VINIQKSRILSIIVIVVGLAALTVLTSIYKINPIGSKDGAGLSPEVSKNLQTVALKTS
jgi:hypothetical protein